VKAQNDSARASNTALLPAQQPSRSNRALMRLQAGVAELLLVCRLRARQRAVQSADVLERAARIVWVTCQHWFVLEAQAHRQPRTRI
jgi:hypothetical protein